MKLELGVRYEPICHQPVFSTRSCRLQIHVVHPSHHKGCRIRGISSVDQSRILFKIMSGYKMSPQHDTNKRTTSTTLYALHHGCYRSRAQGAYELCMSGHTHVISNQIEASAVHSLGHLVFWATATDLSCAVGQWRKQGTYP